MIARIIDASIANRLFIVLAAIAVTLGGFWAYAQLRLMLCPICPMSRLSSDPTIRARRPG